MVIKKAINYEVKIYLIYCLISSVILNGLMMFIPKGAMEYVGVAIDSIPFIMMVIFVYHVWKAFTPEKMYLHIVPLSRKRIFMDIIISWVVSYTLFALTKVIFMALKVDVNILLQDVNVNRLIFDIIESFLAPIFSGMFFASLVLISKIFNRRPISLIIIVLLILPILMGIIGVKEFNNKIEYGEVQVQEQVINDKAEFSEEEYDKSNITTELYQDQVEYKGLVLYGAGLILLLGFCVIKIERCDL